MSSAAWRSSLRLGALTAKLVEVNLVLGIVRLALIVLAMVFSAIPLPFEADMTGTALYALVGRGHRCSTWWPAISSRWRGWLPSSSSGGSYHPACRGHPSRSTVQSSRVPLFLAKAFRSGCITGLLLTTETLKN